VLNVGCQDDPAYINKHAPGRVVNLDLDRWAQPMSVQADAHHLPFADQSFELVLMGDIVEHLVNPTQALIEAARVTQRWLAITVFEEWRLPGHGQHIDFANHHSDLESQRLGFAGKDDFQAHLRQEDGALLLDSFDDEKIPHLSHINQFNDDDMFRFMGILGLQHMKIRSFDKALETVHEGHPIFNWLITMERWH
jgi:hypothetical protein